MTYYIYRRSQNWLRELASILEQAQETDTIVVYNTNVRELATNAAQRMGKPSVRIVTEQEYQQQEQANGNGR